MKFLIVEDSEETSHAVEAALAPLDAECVTVTGLSDAEKKIHEMDFSAFIVDLSLPDGDGFSLVNSIRRQAKYLQAPVIILTGNNEITSKVNAFSSGADDYVMKPFNILELRARVDSKIKRMKSTSSWGPLSLGSASGSSRVGTSAATLNLDIGKDEIVVGPLILLPSQQSVCHKDLNNPIPLSSTEFRILALLARNSGTIYSRDQILEMIWGNADSVTDRTVDSHVYTLRKKLGEYRKLIHSVQGQGYRFLLPA